MGRRHTCREYYGIDLNIIFQSKCSKKLVYVKVSKFTNNMWKYIFTSPTTLPAKFYIDRIWTHQRSELIDKIKTRGGPVILASDGRVDSPGHSAKYGAYYLFDVSSVKVIEFQVVQVCQITAFILYKLIIFTALVLISYCYIKHKFSKDLRMIWLFV
jgi:hypothetical protein